MSASGGSKTPTGTAGGVLTGSYPNPGLGTITGALTHTGTTVGFFGKTPAERPSAYTITYSSSSRTLPATTSVPVSTSSPLNVGALYAYGTAAQAEAIPANINALHEDLEATKKVLAQVIKDLQANGLMQ